MNRNFTIVLLTILLFGLHSVCRGDNEITLKYVTYGDNNKAKISTAATDITFAVTPKTTLSLSGTIDGISGASRKIPIVDGITAATASADTGRIEHRKELAAGITQKLKSNTLSATVDTSAEADYSSLSYFFSWMYEFNNRNNAITLAYSSYQDKLFPFGVTWKDEKSAKIYDLSFTSVLTPRAQMRATASYGHQLGYLSNPYHRVLINDFYYKERNPVERDNLAVGLFYSLGFPGDHVSSLQCDYRFYYDNWNIRSHTVGIKFNQHLNEHLLLSLRQRFYIQSSASFFKNQYPAEEHFITSDPKLAPFSSMLSGVGLSVELTRAISMELLYEHYNQRTNLNYALINHSVAKADLAAHILYMSTTLKF